METNNMKPNVLDSKLYITEAAESKAKVDAELKISDPKDSNAAIAALEKNIVNDKAPAKHERS